MICTDWSLERVALWSLIGLVSFMAACSPNDAVVTTIPVTESSTVAPTTDTTADIADRPVAVDVALSARPGEFVAAPIAVDGHALTNLEDVETVDEGVAIAVRNGSLVVAVGAEEPPGEKVVTIETTGCLDGQCGIEVVVDTQLTVVPYPTDTAALSPLTSPAPDRVRETATAGLFEVADEIVVITDGSVDPFDVAEDAGLEVVGGLPALQTWQMRVRQGAGRDEAIQEVASIVGVVAAVPHFLSDADLSQVVPGDWHDDGPAGTWHFSLVKAPVLWETSNAAPDVTVGVVDSWVWDGHEDLTVRSRAGSCEGSGCTPYLNNGTHGSHVAGLACANGAEEGEGPGLVGMAWGCPLVVYDFAGSGDLYSIDAGETPNMAISMLERVQAMMTVVDQGADVVNISMGFPVLKPPDEPEKPAKCHAPTPEHEAAADAYEQTLVQAIQHATTQRNAEGRPDVVWVVAAGNDCHDARAKVPARMSLAYPNVVTVASVDSNGNLSSFSNWGPAVTVAAPGGTYLPAGEGIWSTTHTNCDTGGCESTYGTKIGTSMAAPIVAGLVALMRQDAPDLPATDLVQCLNAGSTPVTARNPSNSRQPHETPNLDGINLVNAPAAHTCAANPTPLSAEEIGNKIGCHGDCAVTGIVPLKHPTWGLSTLATFLTTPSSDGPWPTGIVVFDAAGTERWRLDVGDDGLFDLYPAGNDHPAAWVPPLYEDAIVHASTDTLGHVFIVWNPGRYDGVMALRPTTDGFDVFDAAYYPAEIVDVDGDGQFEILDMDDCDVGCRSSVSYGSFLSLEYGSLLAEVLYWNGSEYGPRPDAQYTFSIDPDEYELLFGPEISGEPHWSGCSPGTPDSLPDGVWYGYVTDWNRDGIDFDLACDLGWGWDEDCQCDFPDISNVNPATRLLRWAENAQAYAWRRDDPYDPLHGPWTVNELLSGDAKLLTPTDGPPWTGASAPPVLLYINDGVVTELEATLRN